MRPDVRIGLLGGFDVVVDGRPVPSTEWRRRHAAALVKLLALTPGRRLHRERLIDVLWPDLDVETAAPRLHKAAHYARRSLGLADAVVLAGDSVALLPNGHVQVDAETFASLAERALAARDAVLAAQAVDAYAGQLLPADMYEPWTEPERERLQLLALGVLRLAGRWSRVVALDATDEPANLAIARSYLEGGDHRSALRQLERLERALRSELGVGPSADVVRLRERLLQAEADLASVAGSDRVPLVGRETELQRMSRILANVRGSGSGSTLFVAGAAGAGTTALLVELESVAIRHRMRVGTGVAARVEGAWPYAPVLEAVADLTRRHRGLLDALDDDFRAEIERALTGRRAEWDGDGAHQRLFVAVAELMRLAAAETSVVLMVDDLQHADDASLRLLHYLARVAIAEPMVLVLGHRSPAEHLLADLRSGLLARGANGIDVAPLDIRSTAVLLRQSIPNADDDLVGHVYEASEGLPLAVLSAAQVLRADPTTRLASTWDVLLPDLAAVDLSALTAVATLGRSFDTDEFMAVSGLPEDEAYDLLDRAQAMRLVRRGETGFSMRHPMVREALLTRAGDTGRRLAHRRAAEALRFLGRSPARIGHHLVQAGDQVAAVPWLLEAAETDAGLGAYRDALATLEPVRDHAVGPQQARLLSLRADLLNACGDRSASHAYREALAVAQDDEQRSRLRTRLARAATAAGDLPTAAQALQGVELDGSANDPALLLVRGNLAYLQGDLPAADRAVDEARRILDTIGGTRWELFDVISLQGLLAHHRGEWFQQLRLEMRAAPERPELTIGIYDSHLCVAEYLLYGPTPYDEVLDLAAALRTSAERAGVLRAVAFATALRGEAALLKGDLELAAAELADSAAMNHELGSSAGEANSLQRLAEVELARGRRAEATRLLNRALPLARWSPHAMHLLQRVYGSMITAAPNPAMARAVVDRAEATLVDQDRCYFCVIMLAVPAVRACADVGDLEDARRYLQLAEQSEAMWEGTAWQAALLEARAHLARADRRDQDARRLMHDAAELFEAAGQPLDAARCLSA